MNKKFSTLMASLMLASAFSVVNAANNAPTPYEKYVNEKYFMLGDGTNVLSVVSTPGASYGELKMVPVNPTNVDWNLTGTREALWQVKVTSAQIGDAPKYSFVNVATGMTLSVPTPVSNKAGENIIGQGANASLMIAGGYMEWFNGTNPSFKTSTGGYATQDFVSYVNKDEVVYLMGDATDLYVKRGTVSQYQAESTGVVKIMPYKASVVALGKDELNKELIMNNVGDSFTLSFKDDVTEGAENLFTGVSLVAEDAQKDVASENNSAYVSLRLKDDKTKYIVVDTALHTGSEAEKQLPKFAYDDPNKDLEGNAVKRLMKSYNFKFAYEPYGNRVLIKSQAYVTKHADANNAWKIVSTYATADGNEAWTFWPTTGSDAKLVQDAYVRLVTLSTVRELTVAALAADGASVPSHLTGKGEWTNPNDLSYGMLTNVTIGKGIMSYVPTTIESGLYTIQFVKNAEREDAAAGNYYIANLGGAFGFAEQAKNQDFNHMPAAQWYVEKQGTIDSAPIKIWNREFYDNKTISDEYSTEFFGSNVQYQAFKTDEDGVVFFRSNAFDGDTLKFIPVDTKLAADSLLGYKHVDEKQASVETYVFNYLHGLSKDNGLNTPSDKDSLVRVDETGEKVAFRLIPVVEHDSYGIQLDAKKTGVANLIRNAYYVEAYDNLKFAEDGENRYLTYDKASKKYVMSKTPTAYFLKENNCVDGNHYYALVEANFYNVAYKDINTNINSKLYPASVAGKKAAEVDSYAQLINDDVLTEEAPIYFYDKNGQPIVTDASEDVALYAYQENNNGVVELARVKYQASAGAVTTYYYMNPGEGHEGVLVDDPVVATSAEVFTSEKYASSRVSVDDNTLDLTIANISDKWTSEIRVSAFEVAVNDAPLYRRFNGVAPEAYGDAANSPLNLKFYRYNNNAEYLFENYASDNSYRDGITDKSISFLGVNNAYQFEETATRSYTMFVDTAYVRNNTRMPQYLIAVKPEVVEGDTILCDASTHQHATPEEALACEHTQIKVGFTRAMYLFNAQDSVDVKNYDYQGKAAYGAQGYTRLAFKDAVHAQDTLYILNPGVTTEQLKASNLKDDKMFAKKIALDNNKHKNVVFQFRLIDEDNNRFLIESEAEQNGAAVLNKDLQNVCVAPMRGGWVKVQNGVPVIARFQDFNEAIAQAEVFDVNDEIKYDATANDEIAVEGVSVVAGNGQVTIMGAAGKNVTITNILGKVIASQVIASDNATIAVPAGIVAVAVEGEAAVKAIVK